MATFANKLTKNINIVPDLLTSELIGKYAHLVQKVRIDGKNGIMHIYAARNVAEYSGVNIVGFNVEGECSDMFPYITKEGDVIIGLPKTKLYYTHKSKDYQYIVKILTKHILSDKSVELLVVNTLYNLSVCLDDSDSSNGEDTEEYMSDGSCEESSEEMEVDFVKDFNENTEKILLFIEVLFACFIIAFIIRCTINVSI